MKVSLSIWSFGEQDAVEHDSITIQNLSLWKNQKEMQRLVHSLLELRFLWHALRLEWYQSLLLVYTTAESLREKQGIRENRSAMDAISGMESFCCLSANC